VALFRERLPEHLDTQLVIACHGVAMLVGGNPEDLLLEETVQTSGFSTIEIVCVRSSLETLHNQEALERYTGPECRL
jgi:hypothetical protein